MEKLLKIFKDHNQALNSEMNEYKKMTPEQKLDCLQYLREQIYLLNHESRKGFQRVYRVVKRS